MAYDFTLSSGNRQTRSRRSPTESIDVGTSSESLRTIEQRIPSPLTDDRRHQMAFFSKLEDFFRGQQAFFAEKELNEEKKRNADALRVANQRIQENPDKAREAMNSGDFSFFIPDDEVRHRKIVQESFARMVALSDAKADFDSTGRDLINSTPIDGDPRASVAGYLKDQLRGSNPFYAETYTSAFQKSAEPVINGFITERQKAVALKAEATFASNVDAAIADGDIKTVDDINTLTIVGESAIPGVPTPLARRNAQAIIENKLIQATIAPNPKVRERAIALINMPDHNRNGTSIAARRKMDMQQIVAQAANANRNGQAAGMAAKVDELKERFLGGENPNALLTELDSYRLNKGVNPNNAEYNSFRKDLAKAVGKKAYLNMFATMPPGYLPGGDDFGKFRRAAWDGASTGELVNHVMATDPSLRYDQAYGIMIDKLRRIGVPASFPEYFNAHLNHPDNAKLVMRLARQWVQAGGKVDDLTGTSPEGHLMRALITLTDQDPENFNNIYDGLLQAQKGYGENVDPRKSFNSSFHSAVGSQRVAIGDKTGRELAEKAVRKGLDAEGVEVPEIQTAIYQMTNEYMQTLHYLQQGRGMRFDKDFLVREGAKFARDQVDFYSDVNGDFHWRLRDKTLPTFTVVNGQRVAVRPYTTKDVEKFNTDLMDIHPFFERGGFHPQANTARGVIVADGTGLPVEYAPMRSMLVEMDKMPDVLVNSGLIELSWDAKRGIRPGDDANLAIATPRAPGPDFKVTDTPNGQMWASYDPDDRTWGLYFRHDKKVRTLAGVREEFQDARQGAMQRSDVARILEATARERGHLIEKFIKDHSLDAQQAERFRRQYNPSLLDTGGFEKFRRK